MTSNWIRKIYVFEYKKVDVICLFQLFKKTLSTVTTYSNPSCFGVYFHSLVYEITDLCGRTSTYTYFNYLSGYSRNYGYPGTMLMLVLDAVDKICSWTYILIYRLSTDQMGGTTSTVDVTTNSTVMLSFLHWVIPQYIVLAPTSIYSYIETNAVLHMT